MPNYRRPKLTGHTWFFTAVTHGRQRLLDDPRARTALRDAISATRSVKPFQIDAWVLLPDHLHCIWTLPAGDADMARRWSQIKRLVAQRCQSMVDPVFLTPGMRKRREIGFWQPRYWEHAIRDEADWRRHMNYIHYNPVKHGLVTRVCDWPHSTFHRLVRQRWYARDWGDARPDMDGEFGE